MAAEPPAKDAGAALLKCLLAQAAMVSFLRYPPQDYSAKGNWVLQGDDGAQDSVRTMRHPNR